MMDWQNWVRLTISALFAIAHGLKTTILTVLRVAFYVVHLALYPISWVWAILLFVLTPVIHTIRLQFGSAAFVGIAFGLIFTLTTSGLSSILGLYDNSPDQNQKESPHHAKRDLSPYSNNNNNDDDYEEEEDHHDYRRESSPPPRLVGADVEQENLDALLARLDYTQDSDLGSLTTRRSTGWRDSPNTKRKRRSAAALRIGTILEEDDDSL
ncbi:hypothetical protein VMCG_02780 [Cytospora schulzeri]|uniref:Uncharacterized protein n=1 Tax=Cytospora schulzeri TaxID=448051 RepID=A0A423WZW5_9PEZI|nr:hypothetical protein VMCG_02780 [Valsa malicola]